MSTPSTAILNGRIVKTAVRFGSKLLNLGSNRELFNVRVIILPTFNFNRENSGQMDSDRLTMDNNQNWLIRAIRNPNYGDSNYYQGYQMWSAKNVDYNYRDDYRTIRKVSCFKFNYFDLIIFYPKAGLTGH